MFLTDLSNQIMVFRTGAKFIQSISIIIWTKRILLLVRTWQNIGGITRHWWSVSFGPSKWIMNIDIRAGLAPVLIWIHIMMMIFFFFSFLRSCCIFCCVVLCCMFHISNIMLHIKSTLATQNVCIYLWKLHCVCSSISRWFFFFLPYHTSTRHTHKIIPFSLFSKAIKHFLQWYSEIEGCLLA